MRLETLSGVKGLYPASPTTRFTGGGDLGGKLWKRKKFMDT